MADEINIREVSGCICLRLRRAARQVTQIYDRALEPVGLTVNQFGVLAILYGSSMQGHSGLSIGTLADRIGKHATTLNRDLKLLKARRLLFVDVSMADHRVHAVKISGKGRETLRKAVPYWRHAQTEVIQALGANAALGLKDLLDLTSAKLRE